MEDKIGTRPFYGDLIFSYTECHTVGNLRFDERCKTALGYQYSDADDADCDDYSEDNV